MENTESQRIRELLIRTYEGEAWHGPSVKQVLTDIDVLTASQRLPGSHNIIELVRHMAVWRHFAIARLEGNTAFEVTAEEDWTHISIAEETLWQKVKAELEESQQKLVTLLDQLDDSQLEKQVSGRGYNYYVLLHGIVQHDLYHLGQISLLRKLTPL